jgi:tRNA(Ser,Leu) C12 N-acetylase TAN1
MINISVDEQDFDNAMVRRLKERRFWLYRDLERVKTAEKGLIFTSDYETDLKEIRKTLDSMDVVIKYFGGD